MALSRSELALIDSTWHLLIKGVDWPRGLQMDGGWRATWSDELMNFESVDL